MNQLIIQRTKSFNGVKYENIPNLNEKSIFLLLQKPPKERTEIEILQISRYLTRISFLIEQAQ